MTDTPLHSVSVSGIVVDSRGRVLVIRRRDNGHWEPPGGVLELDESPQEGVRREVHEETGVAVEVIGLSGVYKNMQKGVVSLVFRCSAILGDGVETLEAAGVDWVEPRRVRDLMDEAYAVRVDDALRDGVQVRIHDGVALL